MTIRIPNALVLSLVAASFTAIGVGSARSFLHTVRVVRDSSTDRTQFGTTWTRLQNSVGSQDFAVSVTVPGEGRWLIEVHAVVHYWEGSGASTAVRIVEFDGAKTSSWVVAQSNVGKSETVSMPLHHVTAEVLNSQTYTYIEGITGASLSQFNRSSATQAVPWRLT